MTRALGRTIGVTLGLALVLGAAAGVWSGLRAGASPQVAAQIQTWAAVAIGGNLLLCLWLWRRAPAGSGDAVAAPLAALISASMLVGILPRVLWPAAARVHLAASLVSIAMTSAYLVMQIRRWRSVRRGTRPSA